MFCGAGVLSHVLFAYHHKMYIELERVNYACRILFSLWQFKKNNINGSGNHEVTEQQTLSLATVLRKFQLRSGNTTAKKTSTLTGINLDLWVKFVFLHMASRATHVADPRIGLLESLSERLAGQDARTAASNACNHANNTKIKFGASFNICSCKPRQTLFV